MAARIKTLLLAVTPVLFGTWLAARSGLWSPVMTVIAAISACFIQIGTNMWNDAADGARGLDGAERLGPPRVTGLGLLSAAKVRRGAMAAFLIAAAAGMVLILEGGWPILLIGIVSLALGYLYSLGPWPISHTPFGELIAVLFFGVAAVGGVYYLHTGAITGAVLTAGVFLGLPSGAVLLINNHRDRIGDAAAGRRTLAILLGVETTRRLYGALLCATVIGLASLFARSPAGLAIFAALLLYALGLAQAVATTPVNAALNRFIAATAMFQFAALAASATATLFA